VATWPNLHVSQHPAVRHKLGILRDEATEPKKFREVVRELSWLLGYEALADARTQPLEVHTPIEVMAGEELAERIGLIPRYGTWACSATSGRCDRSSTTTSCPTARLSTCA
jgi:uracil phosphoribosyltransferase